MFLLRQYQLAWFKHYKHPQQVPNPTSHKDASSLWYLRKVNWERFEKESRMVIFKMCGKRRKTDKIKFQLIYVYIRNLFLKNFPCKFRDIFLVGNKLFCQSPQPWYHWTGIHTPKLALCYRHPWVLQNYFCDQPGAVPQNILRIKVVAQVLFFPTTGTACETPPCSGCFHGSLICFALVAGRILPVVV